MKARRMLLGGAIAAACTAGTMVSTGIAQASAPPAPSTGGKTGTVRIANPNDCPNGYVCVWGDINYEGRFLFAPGPERQNVGDFMNDLTSSVWNRTGSQVCFYQHADWRGGTLLIVGAGDWRANVGRDANDAISSWRAC
ncbi:peptidase inhibitor family I36 protein [Actinomadura terrae]|uniref:peptidase inhibitor family I36 protein n=1 Tax=Actinomadura terrae TaxID=604353 RepID=UPI001FA6BD98|nr:peptidase inhibitor family I36 protein [Actinomadura terrae]